MSFDPFYARDASYYGVGPSPGLVELLKSRDAKSGRALDLGCGEGRDSLWLADTGYAVTAVDESEVGIEQLRHRVAEKNANIDCVVADVTSFQISQNTYDVVVAGTLLDHLDISDAKKLANQIVSGLRPGGLLFAEVFTTSDPGFTGLGAASETSIFVRHYFRPNELASLFDTLDRIRYEEIIKVDRSHGPVHSHGVATLLARKII